MKKKMTSIICLVLFIVSIISCHKDSECSGCENLIQGNPKIKLLSVHELDTIKYLMDKNKIDYSHLQFWQYANHGYIYISCYQYSNGLKVFTENLSFIQTKSDTILHQSGAIIQNIDATKTPLMNIKNVKKLFLSQIANDDIIKRSGLIIDTCIDLEFGYYNLNLHQILLPKNFTTAWKVTPQNEMYPQAFINDQTGEILDYFNGIYFK